MKCRTGFESPMWIARTNRLGKLWSVICCFTILLTWSRFVCFRSGDNVDEEQTWNTLFAPPPVSSVVTANIMHADDLRSLVTGYVSALPQALRQFISVDPFSDEVDVAAGMRSDSRLER